MRSSRLLAVCHQRPTRHASPLRATCCATIRNSPLIGGALRRCLHSNPALHSLRRKVIASLEPPSSPSSLSSDHNTYNERDAIATSTSSTQSPSSTAPSTSQPTAASSLSPSSSSPSSPASSSSRSSARSASAASPPSSPLLPAVAPLTSSSSSSSSRPALRRAGAVTSFRRREDGQGLVRLARKVDDDCEDPSYGWRMGLIVERLPTVLNPPPAWELEWEQHIERKEARTAIPIPDALKPQAEPESDLTPIDTATAEDASDNRQSLNRRARDSLYLLVKKTNGHTGEATWSFPSVRYTALPYASITPKEAATSSIRLVSGDSLAVHTLSNAPIAYHRYDYSPRYRTAASTQLRGGKLFLFHALYLRGAVDLSEQRASADSRSRYSDHVWVPRSQLHEYIRDVELLHLAVDVLITDQDYADETDVQQLEKEQRDRQRHIVYPQQQQQETGGSDGHEQAATADHSSAASTAASQQQRRRMQTTQ